MSRRFAQGMRLRRGDRIAMVHPGGADHHGAFTAFEPRDRRAAQSQLRLGELAVYLRDLRVDAWPSRPTWTRPPGRPRRDSAYR